MVNIQIVVPRTKQIIVMYFKYVCMYMYTCTFIFLLKIKLSVN